MRVEEKNVHAIELHTVDLGPGRHVQHRVEVDARLRDHVGHLVATSSDPDAREPRTLAVEADAELDAADGDREQVRTGAGCLDLRLLERLPHE